MGSKKNPNITQPVLKNEQRIALFCGDNAEGIKQIKSGGIDAVIIDPNYGINQKPINLDDFLDTLISKENYIRGGTGYGGNEWDAELPKLTHFEQLFNELKPGGYLACFAHPRRDHLVKITIERAGFIIKDPIQWIRTNGTYARGGHKKNGSPNLRVLTETIIIAQKPISKGLTYEKNFKKHKTGLFNTGETTTLDKKPATNVFYQNSNEVKTKLQQSVISGVPIEYDEVIFCQKPDKERELGLELVNEKAKRYSVIQKKTAKGANSHDTVKPVDLMRKLVRLLTSKNGIVLDTYMGSGTCALACLYEGRRFIGMEQDPEYFYISLIRAHTVFFYEVFSKNQKMRRTEIKWHLAGLKEIKKIMKTLNVSISKKRAINKMIAQVKNKLTNRCK
jgi:site-specific DNA-methyltransferase (adenine-specific)